tara:strand:- start:1822 stop:2412 length:591 start_codon:yes stop_codon:yes gene_type:complete
MIEKRKEYKFLFNNVELSYFFNQFEPKIDNLYKTRHVKSLYMDTINKDLYLRSKYDDTSKFKFRYRQYDQEGDIFQEIKFSDFNGKFKFKTKTSFKSFDDVENIIYKGYYLIPKTYVSYNRKYFKFNNEVRMTIDKNLEFENFLTGYNQKLDINVVELKKLHENQNLDFANLFFKNPIKFSKYEKSIESIFFNLKQ